MAKIEGPDGLPDFSMGGAEFGISDEQQQAMSGMLGEFHAASLEVDKALGEAESARQELLSWAALFDRIRTELIPMVEGIITKYQTPAGQPATQATSGRINWKSELFRGLGDAMLLPPAQRAPAVGGVISTVLQGVLNR